MAPTSHRRSLLLPLLGIGLTLAALLLTNRAVTPKDATLDDVAAQARDGGYRLLSTEELRKLYDSGSGNLLLADTRQEWEFALGHIDGAVNFAMEPTWWSRRSKRGDLDRLLGPDRNRQVVFC